ncbi:MAG: peptidylprolyl isomerase [Coriobacteriales bacterium]|jgi:foldase protein PrsA
MKSSMSNAVKSKLSIVVAVMMSLVMVLALMGCSGGSGTAATINGDITISEDEVTEYITQLRTANGLEDDSSWASYLSSAGMTPESIRTQVIDTLVRQKLIEQDAEAKGITVDDSIIDSAVEQAKSYYSSDEEWEQTLESYGLTEETFREGYRQQYIQSALEEQVISYDLSESDIQSGIDEKIADYDGAKRSSHILVDTESKAKDIISQLDGGADFAELAEEYSSDTGSAADGGDVGWDKINSFVTEYQDGLDALDKGEYTSEPVKSDYGYHVILCTDVFNYDSNTTYTEDNIPEDIYSAIIDSIESEKKSELFDEYVSNLVNEADVEIADMPSGLPYDVDMSSASSSDSSSTSSSTSSSSSSSN